MKAAYDKLKAERDELLRRLALAEKHKREWIGRWLKLREKTK